MGQSAVWLTILSATANAGVQLDRVEILADDPGTYLVDELPLVAARPGTAGLRWLMQVQPVLKLTPTVTLGVSASALTPALETPPSDQGFGALVALPTRLGMPSGLVVAGTIRRGPLWVDLGLRATSGSTWRAPGYADLRVGPTLGLAWVPRNSRVPAPDASAHQTETVPNPSHTFAAIPRQR